MAVGAADWPGSPRILPFRPLPGRTPADTADRGVSR